MDRCRRPTRRLDEVAVIRRCPRGDRGTWRRWVVVCALERAAPASTAPGRCCSSERSPRPSCSSRRASCHSTHSVRARTRSAISGRSGHSSSATFAACALHAVRTVTAPGRSELSVRWVEPGRWATRAIVVVAAAFAFLVVPTRTQSEGEFTRRDVWPVMAAVRSQLSAAEQAGTVLVETQHVPFPDYFSWPIMTELDRQGIEFVVDTSDAARQVGLRRRDTGSADVRLYLVFGDWATATFDGTPPDRLRRRWSRWVGGRSLRRGAGHLEHSRRLQTAADVRSPIPARPRTTVST